MLFIPKDAIQADPNREYSNAILLEALIAIIFLAHAGVVDIWQFMQAILKIN